MFAWALNTPVCCEYLTNIQFHWQLGNTHSCFWLVSTMLQKFDTSIKKGIKIIKTSFMMKNKKEVYESIMHLFLNRPPLTHNVCNMLQTLQRRKKCIGIICQTNMSLILFIGFIWQRNKLQSVIPALQVHDEILPSEWSVKTTTKISFYHKTRITKTWIFF